MRVLLGIVGALAGLAVEGRGDQWFFVLTGGALGWCVGQLSELSAELKRMRTARMSTPAAVSVAPAPASRTTGRPPDPQPVVAAPRFERPSDSVAAPDRRSAPPAWWEPALRWLLSGNLPVKVGVLVSFFGVAFLLKYAAEHHLLNVPPAARLLLVGALGLGLGIFGWSLRERMRAYSLGLQGGAVGILYLTVYASLRLYGLVPAGIAFALLFAVALAAGALAYLQRAQVLSVLGSVGGFLAPLLASTGEGSHVALFAYYLVLNAAIFGLAWLTSWRGLNLIGFAFTFIVGTWWGHSYYRPIHYASTQPFLIAFFLIYTSIAALYSLRQAPRLKGIVDATLVFGTPVLALPLQVALLRDSEYGVGYSMVVAALIYASFAFGLRRSGPPTARLLIEAFAALSIAFATMAIPQFLDAHWTAASWALEGAAMVWVGVRQSRQSLRAAGSLLVFAGGVSHLFSASGGEAASLAVFNADFVAGFLVACAGLIAASQLGARRLVRAPHERALRLLLFGWGVLWLIAVGLDEIQDFAPLDHRVDTGLVYLAAAVAIGAAWAARSRQALFGIGSYGLLPAGIAVLAAIMTIEHKTHPFAGFGALAWAAVLTAHWFAVGRAVPRGAREGWWCAGSWLVAALLAFEADWWVADIVGAANAWRVAAVVAVALGVAAAADHIARVRGSADWLRLGLLPVVGVTLAYLAVQNLDHGGGRMSWYFPILNPMDVAAIALLWLGTVWSWPVIRSREAGYAIAFAAWWFLTFAVVRAVHQLAGMAYHLDAAIASMTLQAALSLVWGLAALIAMVVGARRGLRTVWLAGGGLMAVVVVKLFLLDLGSSGTVERIVSFIGVGALLLVVGYLAPVPSRRIPVDA